MVNLPEAITTAVEHYHAGRLQVAEHICRQILDVAPHDAGTLNLLGTINARFGKHVAATACFELALAAYPSWAEAHGNLGLSLKEQGRLAEAAGVLQRAVQMKPDFVEAFNNLGAVFKAQGKPDQAVACFRRVLQLAPDANGVRCDLAHQLQQMCQWEGLTELARQVIEAVDDVSYGQNPAAISPFSFLALPIKTTAQQQLRCTERWAHEELLAAQALGCDRPPRGPVAAKPKITIGYLSADFHLHAVAFLIVELFEKHSRDRFEIIGYSYGPDDGSPIRQRIIRAFDRFVDLKDVSNADATRRIAADGVDILVDLTGYTGDARTQILACRPAPIQVNFLGYPGTMGASFIDYIVVDEFVVPADQQPYFTEKLVPMPSCYQVNDGRREIAPQTSPRAEHGLPENGFVFCSFNNSYKITAEIFDVWMRLLAAVPGSVLWLLESNPFVPVNFAREAQARGIEPERLVFAPRRPVAEHLARHRHADLCLDTITYNAHSTASDALWAGCPLLTIAGETFPSRVAGSLLRTIGLPELITSSLDEYETLALRLAGDRRLLGDLRSRLASNRTMSSLFDAGQFARNLEKAFLAMWDDLASG